MLGQFDSTQEPRFLTQRQGVFGLFAPTQLRRRGGVTGPALTGTGVPLGCWPVWCRWPIVALQVRQRGLGPVLFVVSSGLSGQPTPPCAGRSARL